MSFYSIITTIQFRIKITFSDKSSFLKNQFFHWFEKSEFKDLFLATKESYFIFNNILFKQSDGVDVRSPLGPLLATEFLAFYEKNWLDRCPLEYRPL